MTLKKLLYFALNKFKRLMLYNMPKRETQTQGPLDTTTKQSASPNKKEENNIRNENKELGNQIECIPKLY